MPIFLIEYYIGNREISPLPEVIEKDFTEVGEEYWFWFVVDQFGYSSKQKVKKH